jgi:hypothetical protein
VNISGARHRYRDGHAAETFESPASVSTTLKRSRRVLGSRTSVAMRLLSMSLDRALQIDVGDDLSVDDDERVALEK